MTTRRILTNKRMRIPDNMLPSGRYTKTGSCARENLPAVTSDIDTPNGIMHKGFGLPSVRRYLVSVHETPFVKARGLHSRRFTIQSKAG